VLLKMLNLKLVLVLVTVIGQINCRPKAFRSSGHQLSPEAQRKLAEFRTMLEASEGNTGASDNAADAAAPQIRSSGAPADPSIDAADPSNDAADPAADAADPSADGPPPIDAGDAVDMAGDAADPSADAADLAADTADPMADAADIADPMADAADMADPMADAADTAADAADTAADAADTTADAADTAVDAADAADADAADAANPAAAADRADASDPNGIAADGPIPYGPGGLETDVVDPDGNVMDGPQNPGSGYDGKNGMLGKLMVSIMEKLSQGEPIKMIVDVKNPEVMMSESNNRHSQPGEAGLRTLGNLDKKEKEIVDRNGKTYTYDLKTGSYIET